MGYGTSLGTAHEDEISYVMEKGLTEPTEKQRDDTMEINQNSRSGDFQSRFYATDASTMPLEASRKLTDALKSYGSTETPGKPFETKLSGAEEENFQEWKTQNAPKDSGEDYDLRGAFKAGLTPAENGRWPDTYKKPNHPTFSDQSIYAKDAPDQAGTWDGDRYIPPAVRSSIADDLFGKGENDIRPALGHALETAKNAFALPGDVLSGKVQAGSVQEIERAADLAMLMVGGPAPVAAKAADGSLGSFAGVKSKSLPKDKLYEAQNMELDTMHPDDIWDKTGFFRGADSRWRYEIPDVDAKLKMDAFDKTTTITDNPTGWTSPKNHGEITETIVPKYPIRDTSTHEDFMNYLFNKKNPLTLDKVIDHPELFKAYPELKTMKVEPLPEYAKDGTQGMVIGDTIYLNEGHPEYIKSVLLHEIQHGIQHQEGFAFGGNQNQFLPKELTQAEKEFLAMRSKVETDITENIDVSPKVVKDWKRFIEAEQNDSLDDVSHARLLNFKVSYPNEYKQLSNIVKSEGLIKQAKDEAFSKYQRLMGEVEARNVQARAKMGYYTRKYLPPNRTEDFARFLQHDSSVSGKASSESSQSILRLEKEKTTTDGDRIRSYSIEGNKDLPLRVIEENQGKGLRVSWVGDLFSGENSLGSSKVRSILKALKEDFPNAEYLTGYRTSGARTKVEGNQNKLHPVVINLK